MRLGSLERQVLTFVVRGAGFAFALCAGLGPVSAQPASRLAGDYVCVYGCRLTDANPSVTVKADEADCINEYGGLFQGKVMGPDVVACFRKTGRLSADGLTITWSDGVIWKRHGPAPN